MIKKVLFFVLWTLTATNVAAGKYFNFSSSALDIYQKILRLRFEEANQALSAMKQQDPDNLIGVFLENYLEALRIGIDDDEAAYHRLSKNMNTRLSQLSSGDPRSPYYRYTQAEIRLQWAALRVRFGDYLASLSDIKLAYALLEENDRRFPTFIANKKSLGILHAMVGNVPDDYRWVVRILGGMSGSIEQGLAELEVALTSPVHQDFVFEEETMIAYAMVQLHVNNQGEKAWKILENSRYPPQTHPLSACAMSITAVRTGRGEKAIQILHQWPMGGEYHPFYYRDFLLGMVKLYRLDTDANRPLHSFIDHYPGKNAVKETYQKLAWYELLNGNTSGYYAFMGQVKKQGIARSDPDKVALREADSGEIPDLKLLQARLLFDGGYFSRAFDVLKNISADYTTNPRNNLEYHYRMGRIAHKMGNFASASRYYEHTINVGEKMPWYFACNAALQLGILYEDQADTKSARWWFQKCLTITPEEYAASLHSKAKAGLNRLTKGGSR